MTLVTSKFCEAPITTKMGTSIHIIFMLKRQKPLKVGKVEVIFPTRDQWHSLENICHLFLVFVPGEYIRRVNIHVE